VLRPDEQTYRVSGRGLRKETGRQVVVDESKIYRVLQTHVSSMKNKKKFSEFLKRKIDAREL
jgi:hypothetical protein